MYSKLFVAVLICVVIGHSFAQYRGYSYHERIHHGPPPPPSTSTTTTTSTTTPRTTSTTEAAGNKHFVPLYLVPFKVKHTRPTSTTTSTPTSTSTTTTTSTTESPNNYRKHYYWG